MTEPIDPELFKRLRHGDAAAFDAIYAALRPRLFGFLVRLSRDRALAEDLLQETFLRLARSAPNLDPNTNVRAWLFRVARNLTIDHQRWALLDFDRLFELSLWPRALPDDAATPLDLAEANETQEQVDRALGAMSPMHREVLLLVCVEGLEPSEAAQVVGIGQSTLRKRLSRARQRLAELLQSPAILTAEGATS